MATRIRLRRVGRKGQSYFRIVVADSKSPRDGRFVALIGNYNPRANPAVIPLVENPGTVFVPKARVYVLNEERTVLAGPLVVARRRSYHREWLLGFEGVTSRAAVESWRDQLVAVDE